MSSNINLISSTRCANSTPTCLAHQGKLCRCQTCTSSFVSILSEVSITFPPSDIDDRESFQDLEPSNLPPRAVPAAATTITERGPDDQYNKSSPRKRIVISGPDRSPFKPRARAHPFARTSSASSVASNQTARAPKVSSPPRNKETVSNTIASNFGEEKSATILPPLSARGPVMRVGAQPLGPTRSDYNLTPTPAIPLGRPKNRSLRPTLPPVHERGYD